MDIIEAGSAATSVGERAGIKAVVEADLGCEISTFSRMLKKDVDYAVECGVDSIHLVIPVSDLHIKEKLKKDRAYVMEAAGEVADYAKSHGLIVELSGEDASRADLEFLKELFETVKSDRICFCDTVGVLTPERVTEVVQTLKGIAPLNLHCHNDLGLATANSVKAILEGASGVHVTVNGIGERAGNASLEEVVMALKKLYGVETRIKSERLYHISKLVSRLTKILPSPNKPIVGDNAFTHESGIHVHAILADTATYEPMYPEEVGRKRRFVFGKHTGRKSIEMAVKELEIDASRDELDEILRRVKELGDLGRRITDADLQVIAETVTHVVKDPKVILEDLAVVSGSRITPTASIKLLIDGNEVLEAGTGDGPVDAAMHALRRALGNTTEIKLEKYHVDAISGGTDALVEVIVTLSKGDRVITARGARSDIIMASLDAMIEGINRLYR